MNPTVSVCIATFGDLDVWGPRAERAAASVRSQPAHEVFVHHHFDSSDPSVLGRARNETAARATGEYLAFVDADDELAPGFVAEMLRAIATNPADVYVPWISSWQAKAETWSPPKAVRLRPHQETIAGVIRRADFWRLGGFRDDVEWGEDVEFWMRCAAEGMRFVSVPGAVYRFRRSEGTRHKGVPEERKLELRRMFAADLKGRRVA